MLIDLGHELGRLILGCNSNSESNLLIFDHPSKSATGPEWSIDAQLKLDAEWRLGILVQRPLTR